MYNNCIHGFSSDLRLPETPIKGMLQEDTEIPLTIQPSLDNTLESKLMLTTVMFVCLESGVCITTNNNCSIKLISRKTEEFTEGKEEIVNVNLKVMAHSDVM